MNNEQFKKYLSIFVEHLSERFNSAKERKDGCPSCLKEYYEGRFDALDYALKLTNACFGNFIK